jgi:hypothetical protein
MDRQPDTAPPTRGVGMPEIACPVGRAARGLDGLAGLTQRHVMAVQGWR